MYRKSFTDNYYHPGIFFGWAPWAGSISTKRVGDIVPGVVVYLCLWFHLRFHAWVGWVGDIKCGLIAVARGAFTS